MTEHQKVALGIDTIASRDTENLDSVIGSSHNHNHNHNPHLHRDLNEEDLIAFTRACDKVQRVYINKELDTNPSHVTLAPINDILEQQHYHDTLTSVQSVGESAQESFHYAPYGLDKSKLNFGAKLLSFGNPLKVSKFGTFKYKNEQIDPEMILKMLKN